MASHLNDSGASSPDSDVNLHLAYRCVADFLTAREAATCMCVNSEWSSALSAPGSLGCWREIDIAGCVPQAAPTVFSWTQSNAALMASCRRLRVSMDNGYSVNSLPPLSEHSELSPARSRPKRCPDPIWHTQDPFPLLEDEISHALDTAAFQSEEVRLVMWILDAMPDLEILEVTNAAGEDGAIRCLNAYLKYYYTSMVSLGLLGGVRDAPERDVNGQLWLAELCSPRTLPNLAGLVLGQGAACWSADTIMYFAGLDDTRLSTFHIFVFDIDIVSEAALHLIRYAQTRRQSLGSHKDLVCTGVPVDKVYLPKIPLELDINGELLVDYTARREAVRE